MGELETMLAEAQKQHAAARRLVVMSVALAVFGALMLVLSCLQVYR